MKNRKAVSALIATIILVAFVIIAAAVITSFLTGVVKFQTRSVSVQAVCAQKGSLFIDAAMCTRVRDTSLAGYWKFDSVNSTNYTADSSGYGSDGRLYNGTANCFNATGCINLTGGQINSALTFDGVNDYVDAGNNSVLDFGIGTFTVSAWVKRGCSSCGINSIGGRFNTSGYYVIFQGDNTIMFTTSANVPCSGMCIAVDNADRLTSINTVTDIASWHFVTVTRDTGGTKRIYIDGSPDPSGSIFSGNVSASANFWIGNSIKDAWNDFGSQYFNGTIDEVKIWNRSLSADEINQHYQKGLEKFAVDGYFKTIKAAVRNIGTTPLSNFTVFVDINGRLYQNDTPDNGGATLPAASEPLTLQAYTYYNGPIRTLKVSVLNCPISMTLANDSTAVGTC